MCSFDFACSELNFFDCCARSPRSFEIIVPSRSDGWEESVRSEDGFSKPSVCEAVANFWKLSERSFGRWCFILDESICPKDFIEAFSFFKRHTEGAVLLNFKWPRSGHKLMASLRLELEESLVSWAAGAHGRATRATCVRGTFILEGEIQRRRWRQQGRCRLADWAQGLSLCDWGNTSHTKKYPHSRHL